MKQTVLRACIVIVLLGSILSVREIFLLPDGKFHVYFLDVGQGDSTFVVLPEGTQILIDGGPDWSALEKIGTLMPFFDRSIDFVILSHPNLDHLASFPEVVRRYRIGALLLHGSPYELGSYTALLSGATARGVPVVRLAAGKDIDLSDDVHLETLWPPKEMPRGMSKDMNNQSLVQRLSYKGHSILLTGDMEKVVEDTLRAAGVDLRSDILKVPHHGSKSSSSTGFLLAVSPSVAVVSVGKENTYGHPNPGVLERLEAMGVIVHRTDLERTIELMW